MADTVNLTLGIRADISQASQQINTLKTQLDSIWKASSVVDNKGLPSQITEASHAALQLKQNLESAFNVNTGKLDLSKFNQNLKASGMSLTDYQAKLSLIGPAGDQAFNSLATAIQYAEIPLRRTHALLDQFFDGLKRTAMWTIQSNAIHGVQSALRGAYTYAQQLNKGLTDIAIVSDLNAQQLTQFAQTANKMAKELSASTADYVSGALIYYQAGLTDEEVIERTNTTIKLAQTSGETAESISSYMTAIWNNFYDGSKSIEYYADAISYLGAKTAASNADIAEGMQAFSAVANTVGLSFEYGAAALTTLRDITQQSASTIGNSLKTIFARLSSVKQGESLEDGVDLTKYSKALEQVGVNVLDVNGDLKDMDTILDELGARWDKLNDAQKVALAQTVGGVRQYNNLISLMDNYERFQELVKDSQDSEGYLQHQAEIYAESWEGASNRARAAWQEFYSEIISDKFFIGLKKIEAGFAGLLTGVVKSFGGIGGTISAIGSLIFTLFSSKIADGLRTFAYNLGFARKELREMQEQAVQGQIKFYADAAKSDALYADNVKEFGKQLTTYNTLKDKMSESERAYYQAILDVNRGMIERIRVLKQEAEETNRLQKNRIRSTKISYSLRTDNEEDRKNFNAAIEDYKSSINRYYAGDLGRTGLTSIVNSDLTDSEKIAQLTARINELDEALQGQGLPTFEENFKELVALIKQPDAAQNLDEIKQKIKETLDPNELEKGMTRAETALMKLAKSSGVSDERLQDLVSIMQDAGFVTADLARKVLEARDAFNATHITTKQFTDAFTETVQALQVATRAIAGIDALAGIFDDVKKGTFDFSKVLSSLLMILMAFLPVINTISKHGWAEVGTGSRIGIAITVLYALYTIIKKVKEAIKEKEYLQSAQKQVDDLTAALEKQKNVIKELSSAYSNLKSTISGLKDAYKELQEAATKYGLGSPQYLLALSEYEAKIDELEETYGDIFDRDENGIRQINETKYAEAALREFNSAKAQELVLKNSLLNANVANAQEHLIAEKKTGFTSTKETSAYNQEGQYETISEAIWTKIFGNKVFEIQQDIADNIFSGIEAGITQLKTGGTFDLDKLLQEQGLNPEDTAYQYFISIFKDFNDALQEKQNTKYNFSDFAQSALISSGLYGAAEQNGISPDVLNDALNAHINTVNVSDEEKQLGYAQYAKAHELTYKNGKFFNDNNEDVTNTVNTGAIDQSVQWSKAMTDLTDKLGTEQLNILQDWFPDEDQEKIQGTLEKLLQYERDAAQLAEDVKKAEGLGLDTDEFKEYVEYLQSLEKYAGLAQEQIDEIALANMRLNRGVGSLVDNYEDWSDIIIQAGKEGNEWMKDNLEYKNAITGTKEALADLANIDASQISDDFVTNKHNLDLMREASYGNVDAIDELIKAIAVDFAKTLEDSKDQVSEWEQELIDGINEVNFNKIEIGTSIEDQPFYETLKKMIEAGAVAADEVNGFLARIGYSPIVEEMEIPVSHENVSYDEAAGTYTVRDSEGNTYTLQNSAEVANQVKETGMIKIPIIKGSNDGKGGYQLAGSSTMAGALSKSIFTGGTGKNTTQENRGKGASNRPKGGSDSKQKTKEKDVTRYHEINAKLEQISAELDKIATIKDRAFGQDKLDAMNKEIELLTQQAALYEELRAEAQKYYEMDKKRLAEQYGATFNPDGTIANYDAWYKSFIDKYNSGAMDDDAWSKFEEAIQKYEESLNKLDEAEKQHQDAMNKIYDEKLEKIEYRLKTVTKILDTHIKYLDYIIDKLDEDAYDAAEQLARMSEKANKILDKINEYRKDLNGIFENHGINSTIIQQFLDGTITVEEMLAQVDGLTQDEIDTMYDYIDALLDLNKELESLRKDAYEQLGQVIDKMNEKLQDQRDIMEEMSKVMSHYKNIVDVVGKDLLGITSDMMNQMAQMQVVSAQGLLQNSRARKEALEEILANLQAERALITDENSADAKYLDEQIKKTQQELSEATEQWWSDFEEATQRIEEARKTMAENAVLDFEKIMAGSLGSLDALQDFYDKEKKVRDLYLKDYERIYDLNKLSRDVAKSLDNTNNIGGTQRLLELQQEILDLQKSGKDINEYDVGVLQRKLELEQARIAMEEAQNAKNMVRMTRDSEGNWSYTYTADASAIDNARENYENKLYELEKFIDERQESLQSLFLENLKDYMNDLGIAEEDRVEYIKEHYDEIQAKYADFLGDTFKDNQWIIDNFGVLDHNLAATWDNLLLSQATGYNTLDGFMQTYVRSSQQAATAVSTAWGWMQKAMEETFKLAGVPMEDFAKKMADYLSKVKEKTDKAAESSRDFAKEAEKAYQAALKAIHDFRLSYGLEIDAILAKNLEAYKQIEKLIEQYSRLDTSRNTPTEPTPEPTPTTQPEPQPQPQPTPQPASGGGDGVPNVGDEVTFEWGDYHSDSYGGGPHGSRGHGQKFKITYMAPGRPYPIHIGSYGWLSQAQISGYDTGGYTGAWGPNGRIAMLHEKELVLNKADTENLLTTISFVRDLTRMISLNAAEAGNGLGNLFSTGVGQGGGFLDQNVTIHAEFPNATNHSEIEEAFSNLIGLASQYAGRRK